MPGLDDPIGVVSFGCSSESAPPRGMPSMVSRLRVDPPQTMTVTHTISKVAGIQNKSNIKGARSYYSTDWENWLGDWENLEPMMQ